MTVPKFALGALAAIALIAVSLFAYTAWEESQDGPVENAVEGIHDAVDG